ncbi:MAG: LLM class flavin-dependent oxidoreductase, partial [Pseudomonadota bacterium]
QVVRLLSETEVTEDGRFHAYRNVTSLPRPVQVPHPPVWQAAFSTEQSFEEAGRKGYYVMGIPLAGERMKDLMAIYREAWQAAGHPGEAKMMLSFAMFCAPTEDQAVAVARPCLNGYLKAMLDAAGTWTDGIKSADYPGYDRMFAALKLESFETQREKGIAWVGTPNQIGDMIADYIATVGSFEIASLQVNFHDMPLDSAKSSMRLFAEQVMPRIRED